MHMNFEMKPYKIVYYTLLAVFFSMTIGYAQNPTNKRGMKLEDNSVSFPSNEMLPFSILDLSSAERGFLLPKLTTEQRRNIPKADLQQGLMIYNTTIDCMEFYNQTRDRWLNLCGEIELATFVIQDSKCSKIQIEGNYFEGVFLRERTNVIFLEVNVSTPGTYQVEATAYNGGNPNGYAFQGAGIFPEAGNYHIVLRGTGTPIQGYVRDGNGAPTSQGDTIKFILNGKESSCIIYNFVEKESLKYKINRIDPVGKFYTGVPLTNAKSGDLEATLVDITMGGTVEIHTVDNNGISFSGRHTLSNAEIASRTAKVVLRGEGTPAIPKDTPLNFFTNSHVQVEIGQPAEFFPYTVGIEPLYVNFLCNNAAYPISHEGVFEYNTVLTEANKIHVPIKVVATGRGEVVGTVEITGTGYGQQTEKIEFTSGKIDFEFNNLRDDVQNVVLKPKWGTGKPTVGNKDIVVKLKLTSRGAHEYDPSYPIEESIVNGCDYNIPVIGAPVIYELRDVRLFSRFRSITQSGNPYYITPKTKMPDEGSNEFVLYVTLVPQTAGEYEIKTNTLNGVYFYGKGIIEESDVTRRSKEIILKAYGKSDRDLPRAQALYTLTGNSEVPQSTPARVYVDYVYRPMKMYSIGGSSESWHPGGNNGWSFSGGPRLVRSLDNFSWNGVVRIDKLDIIGIASAQSSSYINTSVDMSNTSNASTFRSRLNQADMVFIGGYNAANFAKQDTQLSFLADYVKRENGVLMYGEGNDVHMRSFFQKLGYNISTQDYSRSAVSRVVSYPGTANPLILGNNYSYFGSTYQNISLPGRNIRSGGSASTFSITNLPSDFETIAYNGSSNLSFAYVHKTLGFVGVNNSVFMGGYVTTAGATNTKADNYPMNSTTNGTPLVGNDTYNSWFLLNLVHWAIDYAQEHQPNVVK
ncbi:hypothetical protein HX004_07930 [Myroides sp. 1354]|nr:hypothetical protein [Myroides sp. R163-1]MDM1055703.1 hypothetical protein [Myroides sp. 1354]MDM1069795.1 hypothetical protein [Myroides sp. 1372]